MITRYSQIQQQVKELAAMLSAPGHIQKIYSTSRYLCFQIRLRGKTICVYFGRGSGHEGLWIGSTIPPSFLRLRDQWLEWCKKHLASALLLEVHVDPIDRGFVFKIQKAGVQFDFHVSWIGRSCYFAYYDHESSKWFTNWKGSFDGLPGFEVFSDVGRRAIDDQRAFSPQPPIEDLLKLEQELALKAAKPKTETKALERKKLKIQEDLEKIRDWKLLSEWLGQHEATELESMAQFKLGKLKYKFPQALTAWQKRDWLFQQIKRLKLAESLQSSRLGEVVKSQESMDANTESEENPLRPVGLIWQTSKTAPKPTVVEGDYKILDRDGFKLGVGTSAQGNDQLRKSWATSDDWWVHAANGTSAHAIIKLSSPGSPTPSQLSAAADAIAKQSGIQSTHLEIITTQVKNVRGVTGRAGMVTYKKQKQLLCELSRGDE